MKRLLTMIIIIAMVLLPGCSTAKFDDADGLAQAMALAYHTGSWESGPDTVTSEDNFVMTAAGWYAALRARMNDSDKASVSDAEMSAISSVLGGKVTRGADFPDIYEFLGNYLGVTAEISCEETSPFSYTVRITDHFDSGDTGEYLFRISFTENKGRLTLTAFEALPMSAGQSTI